MVNYLIDGLYQTSITISWRTNIKLERYSQHKLRFDNYEIQFGWDNFTFTYKLIQHSSTEEFILQQRFDF